MRRFLLVRDEDVSGVSGTGVVADGVVFRDGATVLRWRGDDASTAVWGDLTAAMRIHGHGGLTRVEWVDAHPTDALPAQSK